jgi:hypothetical protein
LALIGDASKICLQLELATDLCQLSYSYLLQEFVSLLWRMYSIEFDTIKYLSIELVYISAAKLRHRQTSMPINTIQHNENKEEDF